MSQRNNINRLISLRHRRLQALKEYRARLGYNTPPEIISEIEDIEKELERLAAALRNADDTPDPTSVSTGGEPFLSESTGRQIDTDGGPYYEGSIDTGGGNFAGRDYNIIQDEEPRTKLFRNCSIFVLVVLLCLVTVVVCVFGGWAVRSLEGTKHLLGLGLTPTPTVPIAKKLYYFVILDASVRMKEGDVKKWDMAQDTLQTLLESSLPSRANYGLIVVGGAHSNRLQGCDQPQQPAVQLEPDARAKILNVVKRLQPEGTGSLEKAIILARNRLLELSDREFEKTIVIITGGGDECVDPQRKWTIIFDIFEHFPQSLRPWTELVILQGEEVDEEVQNLVQRVHEVEITQITENSSEVDRQILMDSIVSRSVERARQVEPTAVAVEETLVAKKVEPESSVPSVETSTITEGTFVTDIPSPNPLPLESAQEENIEPSQGSGQKSEPIDRPTDSSSSNSSPTETHKPSLEATPTATLVPAPTPIEANPVPPVISTKTPIPTNTPTPTNTSTNAPTSTNTPTHTATPTHTPTKTYTPTPTPVPTSTPTPTPNLTIDSLSPQPFVFEENCLLLNTSNQYKRFFQGPANISVTSTEDGKKGQALRLNFSSVQQEGSRYAGWEVWLADEGEGIDLSAYSSLEFYIRGAAGGEMPNVYLMEPIINGDPPRNWKDVEEIRQITTSWQSVAIPLSHFETTGGGHIGIDLENIHRIQFVFEWYSQPTSGEIFVDELCVR